jgi:hypothetical protein
VAGDVGDENEKNSSGRSKRPTRPDADPRPGIGTSRSSVPSRVYSRTTLATSWSESTPILPATSDAPSIGSSPSGTTVVHVFGSGADAGVATILRLGVALSIWRYSFPLATPSGK